MIEAINLLTEQITTEIDLDDLMETMSLQFVHYGIFRSLMIALVNEKNQTVRVPSSAFLHPTKGTIVKKAEDGVIGTTYALDDDNITAVVARTGETKIVDEWDDRFDKRISLRNNFDRKVSYFIPVKIGSKTIAVLATGSTFDEKEQMLAKIESMGPLFNQVAVALKHAMLIRDLRSARDEAEHTGRFLRGLYEIAANEQWGVDRQIEETLTLGCDLLGTEIGLVSRINGDPYHIQHLQAGFYDPQLAEYDLSKTFCSTTIDRSALVAIDDATQGEWQEHKSFRAHKFASYIGIPVWIDQRIYGTVSFFSKDRRSIPFRDTGKDYVHLMARWITTMLARSLAEKQLAHRSSHISALYDAVSKSHKEEAPVQSVLRSGCEILGCNVGVVSRVENESYIVESTFTTGPLLKPGFTMNLDETYCKDSLDRNEPIAIHQAGHSEWANHPSYLEYGVETYVGVPLIVNDSPMAR